MHSLRTRLGDLGLEIFAETAENEYKDSTRITSNLQAQILGINNNESKTRGEVKVEREKRSPERLRQFRAISDGLWKNKKNDRN